MKTHVGSRVNLAAVALFATLGVVAPASAGPTGACCMIGLTEDCLDLTEADCTTEEGVFQGVGTTCATTGCGACCIPPGSLACDIDADCQDGNCVGDPNPGDGTAEGTCSSGQCLITGQVDCTTNQPLGSVYQGDGTTCGLCAFVDCTQDPGNCQMANIPQFPGGVILTSIATRDNFVPTITQDITSVCWWGAYISGVANVDCGPGPGDIVTITYFKNIEGFPPTPGPVLAGPFDVSGTTAKVTTGLEFGLGDFDDPVAEFEYTATHPPVPVEAGACYWIEITIPTFFPWDCQADPDGSVGINDFLAVLAQWGTDGSCDFNGGGVGINDFLDVLANWGSEICNWFWEVSPEGMDLVSIQADLNTNDFDMAWCIDQPLDNTLICPPVAPGCEEATNSCLQANDPLPGCNNSECCSLVCVDLGLAFCCTEGFGWDQQCAAAAADFCVTEFPSFDLTSPDGMWAATISDTGQIITLTPPGKMAGNELFETILYEASTAGGNLSRPVDTNFVLVEASILDGASRSLGRLEAVDSDLVIEIENTMIDGPTGGVQITVRCENTGPDPVDCKIFCYCDMDIGGDFPDDEAMLVPDPPMPALIAIEQIDCNTVPPDPTCDPGMDGFQPLWFGGCGPYKSWEIDTWQFLRIALNGGIAQLGNVDGTVPGSDDHTAAFSGETATLMTGEISEISFGVGGVGFTCRP